MSETKVPALPAPTSDNLLQVARALKSMLDVREGRTGDALDANVTFRDLIDSGLAQVRPGFSGFRGGAMPVLPPWVQNDGYDPTQDFVAPPKPTGLTASGLFATVQLQWDEPTYRNHSYAEVWRSDTNVLGNAVLIGTSDSRFFVDSLGTGATRYYWVRFVSEAGITGAYNDTNGLEASTSQDPTYLMDVLSDAFGSTSKAPFFQIDQPTVINGVSIPAGTYIKQAFIADATISRAKIQLLAVDNARIANIDAGKITTGFLDAGRIEANSIDASKIDTRNLTIKDSAGNIVFSASGVSVTNITGLGSLATKNSVAANEVSGLGTLATKDSVSTSDVSGLGTFATLSKINTGNINTYIEAGAITNAYIGNFISSTNFDGSIDANGNIINFGLNGWAIGKGGSAVLNSAKIRGEINGGAYTGFAWPSGSGTGFHLGPFGLLLGNFNTGRYVQIDATGNFFAPGITISNGSATFSGLLTTARINVGSSANAVDFIDPSQPSVPLVSVANGFLAFSGDTGVSTLVPATCFDSKSGASFDCSYFTFAGAPVTSIQLLFTTNSTSTDLNRRIRSGAVRFLVIASGTVDQYLSIWYRYTNSSGTSGTWLPIAMATEPQSNYGSATVSSTGVLGVSLGQNIQFGFAATDTSGNFWNSNLRQIRDGSISVLVFNF